MQLESRERPTVTRGFAVLRYVTPANPKKNVTYAPPVTAPLTLPNTTTNFLEYALSPYAHDDSFPTAEEVTRRVTITVHQRVAGQTIWLENSYPWTEGVVSEPYLVSLYKNNFSSFPSYERALANGGLDNITRTFPAQTGEIIEIVLQNTGADAGGLDVHPFHAHGSHYYDIGAGNGTYNATANEIILKEKMMAGVNGMRWSPIKRDTTMLYRYATGATNGTNAGWRAWRLKVTEPGVWMIHCHILQHMLM